MPLFESALSSGHRRLFRFFLVSATLISSLLVAQAQSVIPLKEIPLKETSPGVVASGKPATNVDETFELNIVERRYSEDSFAADTAVAINTDDGKLNVQIGVAVASGRIEVLLRNVHGAVRFRGSLDRILQVIKDRQNPSPAGSPAPSPATPRKNE